MASVLAAIKRYLGYTRYITGPLVKLLAFAKPVASIALKFAGPLGPVISSVAAAVIGPLGRWIAIALVGLSILGIVYHKGQVAEHKEVITVIQKEIVHEVDSAKTARSRATSNIGAGRVRNDGFARD